MKEFKLNPNSWHFKLATLWKTQGYKHWLINTGTNICEYTWEVSRGFLKLISAFAFGAVMVAWFVKSVYDIVMLFFGGEFTPFAFSLTIITFIFLTFFMWEGTRILFRKVKEKTENTETPPTFFGLAYRKFKDKTCFKINFK